MDAGAEPIDVDGLGIELFDADSTASSSVNFDQSTAVRSKGQIPHLRNPFLIVAMTMLFFECFSKDCCEITTIHNKDATSDQGYQLRLMRILGKMIFQRFEHCNIQGLKEIGEMRWKAIKNNVVFAS